MNYRLRAAICALATLACAMNPAMSQEKNSSARRSDAGRQKAVAVVKVFGLKYIQANDALIIISTLNGRKQTARLAVDNRGNSLIASGTKEELAVIEALLVKLDVPREPEPKLETVVLNLKNVSSKEASKTIESTLKLKKTSWEAHSGTNRLVISGIRDEVDQVVKLIETLERDNPRTMPKQMMLRVVWLVPHALNTGVPVPEDLTGLISKLSKKVGIGKLDVASQMLINVGQTKKGRFNSEGTVEIGAPEPCQFEVTGEYDSESRSFEIQMMAREAKNIVCALSTNVNAKPGHPIVLGMTSIKSKESLFVLEVISLDDGDLTPKNSGNKKPTK